MDFTVNVATSRVFTPELFCTSKVAVNGTGGIVAVAVLPASYTRTVPSLNRNLYNAGVGLTDAVNVTVAPGAGNAGDAMRVPLNAAGGGAAGAPISMTCAFAPIMVLKLAVLARVDTGVS